MRWLVLLLLPLAGCLTETPDEASHAAHGSFTQDRTEADLQDFHATTSKWGADVVIMESFPEQFRVTLGETDCYLLIQELEDKSYIASVGACMPVSK